MTQDNPPMDTVESVDSADSVESVESLEAVSGDTVVDAAEASEVSEAAEPEVAVAEPELAAEPEAEVAVAEPEPVAEPAPAPTVAATPTPGSIPSPAMFARKAPAAPAPGGSGTSVSAPTTPVVAPAAAADTFTPEQLEAAKAFGRVDEHGLVHVRVGDEEREVGSYPDTTADEALAYFARKYFELESHVDLLEQRIAQPGVATKDLAEGHKALQASLKDAHVVGDLAGLHARVDALTEAIEQRRQEEREVRAKAREAAAAEREAIVTQAEQIAGQPEKSIQWKQSGERMRALLDQWKEHQRSSVRLDKETEHALWQRFAAARNSFDKGRKSFFANLDATHSDAKAVKERLVKEAEDLAQSKDWKSTAGAFKKLMDQWRVAGRAARNDDEALWQRFKAAQDSFFAAKDEVVAAEDEEYRGNLTVKEKLLLEAEALLPIKKLEDAKAALRGIQDRWDAAGKVPRADMERIEKGLRRVEQAVRDADEHKWKASNPEAAARAASLVTQLEDAVAGLEADLAAAQTKGDTKKVAALTESLEARKAWLAQAQAGLNEFS